METGIFNLRFTVLPISNLIGKMTRSPLRVIYEERQPVQKPPSIVNNN